MMPVTLIVSSICSHILPFDATVLIFYMNIIDALLIRIGKKFQPENAAIFLL
jgi:hypothetical protein